MHTVQINFISLCYHRGICTAGAIDYTTVFDKLFQVEDKTALVLRSDQRRLDTPALVSETLIRLAADDLMSQQNVSQSNIEFALITRQMTLLVCKLCYPDIQP